MGRFQEGNRVRVDIPDESDSDHHYHGEHGTVTKTVSDDLHEKTGDFRDSQIYRVRLESGEVVDFRGWDFRPPLE